jgi:hypothetical protein
MRSSVSAGRWSTCPYDEWWQAIVTSRVNGIEGLFVHPVQDEAVMAGNGTIGLETLDDLPPGRCRDPVRGRRDDRWYPQRDPRHQPDTKIYSAELAKGAALAGALAAGEPVEVGYTASFLDGSGSQLRCQESDTWATVSHHNGAWRVYSGFGWVDAPFAARATRVRRGCHGS